uniref:Uncharacterized protein n=1 Tax=Arundo donax TaxID=35708 RepID=A0A0A9ATD6_ARUDO
MALYNDAYQCCTGQARSFSCCTCICMLSSSDTTCLFYLGNSSVFSC